MSILRKNLLSPKNFRTLTTIPMPKNRAGDITLRVTGAYTKNPKRTEKNRKEPGKRSIPKNEL
ncbi:MAG: hypothetical protein CVU46_16860 [Chloroflexi bacterium HGW-Chloroflexi-8]|nr:MAG: hypothetical protein CVU46_16860 [Chloroflexi bacterium HGW-Chloroflexi-8]